MVKPGERLIHANRASFLCPPSFNDGHAYYLSLKEGVNDGYEICSFFLGAFPSGAVERAAMIAWNTNFPFGGRASLVQSKGFQCSVSTAKDGLFKKRVTMVLETAAPLGQPEGRITGRPVAKFVYSESLRPDDYLRMHDLIVVMIDGAGDENCSLGQSIEIAADTLRTKGIIKECLNLLAETSLEKELNTFVTTTHHEIDACIDRAMIVIGCYLKFRYCIQLKDEQKALSLAAAVTNKLFHKLPTNLAGEAFLQNFPALVELAFSAISEESQVRHLVNLLIYTKFTVSGRSSTVTPELLLWIDCLAQSGILINDYEDRIASSTADLMTRVQEFEVWVRDIIMNTPAPAEFEPIEFALFNCPDCSKRVRIPSGKGKVKIRCPQCSCTFVRQA